MSDALKRLIKAVEADAFDAMVARFNGFADAWEAAFGIYTAPNYDTGFRAYCGSLDSAKTLHDALLPGWLGLFTLEGGAKVTDCDTVTVKEHDGAVASNPARAWLLAILRAKLAENHQRQETSV